MNETLVRQNEAMGIVRANAGWSAAAGLAPFPLLDLAAITAVQLRMVKQLADLYGVPFKKDLAKTLIATAIGSSASVMIAAPLASLVKVVPFVGTFIGTFATPAAGAATTFALGKVFIQHFEAGGTLLDLDPEALRQHFYDEYRRREAESRQDAQAAA